MNGDSEYLDIYKYCKQLSILILKNNADELCGRALIWRISDDITLMDRVYIAILKTGGEKKTIKATIIKRYLLTLMAKKL